MLFLQNIRQPKLDVRHDVIGRRSCEKYLIFVSVVNVSLVACIEHFFIFLQLNMNGECKNRKLISNDVLHTNGICAHSHWWKVNFCYKKNLWNIEANIGKILVAVMIHLIKSDRFGTRKNIIEINSWGKIYVYYACLCLNLKEAANFTWR